MTGANLSAELLGTAYGFVRQLAMGGMGEVAIVEHVALGEQRVMKLLRADYAKNTDLTTRLRTEARLLTRLQHENLVRVLDFGFSAKGRPFLVTELLRGEPLSTALKGSPGMPEREALEIARQTLLGLERVHEAGFVHRDLKPDNPFLVKSEGQTTAKILDFGIARIPTPADRASLGQLRPTVNQLAPRTAPWRDGSRFPSLRRPEPGTAEWTTCVSWSDQPHRPPTKRLCASPLPRTRSASTRPKILRGPIRIRVRGCGLATIRGPRTRC